MGSFLCYCLGIQLSAVCVCEVYHGALYQGSVAICPVSLLWAAVSLGILFFCPTCGSTYFSACQRVSTLLMDPLVIRQAIGSFLSFGLSALLTHSVYIGCSSPTGVPCLTGLETCPLLVCLRHGVVNMPSMEDSCLKIPTQIPCHLIGTKGTKNSILVPGHQSPPRAWTLFSTVLTAAATPPPNAELWFPHRFVAAFMLCHGWEGDCRQREDRFC